MGGGDIVAGHGQAGRRAWTSEALPQSGPTFRPQCALSPATNADLRARSGPDGHEQPVRVALRRVGKLRCSPARCRRAATAQAQASSKSSAAAPRGGACARSSAGSPAGMQQGAALGHAVRPCGATSPSWAAVSGRPPFIAMNAPSGWLSKTRGRGPDRPAAARRSRGSWETGRSACFEILRGGSRRRERRIAGGAIIACFDGSARGHREHRACRAPRCGRSAASGPRPPAPIRSGRPMGMSTATTPRADRCARAMPRSRGAHATRGRGLPVAVQQHRDPSDRAAVHPRNPRHVRCIHPATFRP